MVERHIQSGETQHEEEGQKTFIRKTEGGRDVGIAIVQQACAQAKGTADGPTLLRTVKG